MAIPQDFSDFISLIRSGRRSVSNPMKEQLDLENVALRNIELRQKLSEPSQYQQEQAKQEGERQKYIFSTIKDLALDVRVPQATRDYYNSMMSMHYYSLTPEMQNILTPLLVNSPMDANTQKVEFFDKYGDQPPEKPYTSKLGKFANTGDELPRTQENAQRWAEYDIGMAEYTMKRNLFLFGKDYANTVKLPKFHQPVEWIGEGEQRRPGDFWYRDPDTQRITNIPASIAEADTKKLEDWGWTMARVRNSGLRPVAEPIMATVGGNRVQITPVKDLVTGRESYEVFSYDKNDDTVKKLPPKILTALGELGRGTSYDDTKAVKDGEVANVMRVLTEFEDAYGKTPTQEQLNSLNTRLQAYYPEMTGNRLVRIPKDKQGFMRKMLNIPGTEWSIIPVTSTRNVTDRTGNSGTVFVDEASGRTFAADGTEIMQSNVKEGDTITSINFKPEIIAGQMPLPEDQGTIDKLRAAWQQNRNTLEQAPNWYIINAILEQAGGNIADTVKILAEAAFTIDPDAPPITNKHVLGYHTEENQMKLKEWRKTHPEGGK